MKEASTALWRHPLVVGAVGITILIAIASVAYYTISTRLPSPTLSTATFGSIQEVVTGTGTVEPAQNPDLGFVSGGRVATVTVAVGDKVQKGELLASLDTATLLAQRANAEANLASQQATLAQMQAGPRSVDIQPKQNALDQANQTVQNVYANVPANINNAYGQALSGVSASTDTLFNQPNTYNPTLAFNTSNNQASSDAINGRVLANGTLAAWNTSLAQLSQASTPAQLDMALTNAISNLQIIQTFSSTVITALNSAIPTSSFSQSSLTAAQTAVGGLRTSINALILSLQGVQQQLASDKLNVQSAQDALNLTLAGVSSQTIEAQQAQVQAAQATVSLYDAQINNATIVAPFSGTISSVRIKSGDIAAPNTPAISLNPEGSLQITVYLSEVDSAKVVVGNQASVTLDAYGSAQPFSATVVGIDHSPTIQNNVPAYKATLQFSNPDPRITSGATANVTIITAQKDNVLVIPASAVIQSGDKYFVLVSNGATPIERQVELGIQSTTSDEVTSGLEEGDQFLINSK